MTKFLTIPLTALLLAGVLGAQWLAVLPVLPSLAHAPQHECAQHRCGCPAELTARHACCCFHHEAGPQGIVGTLIRSAQCTGDAAPQTAALVKLDWTMPVIEPVIHLAGVRADVVDFAKAFSIRIPEPPVPPPKSPLCFV